MNDGNKSEEDRQDTSAEKSEKHEAISLHPEDLSEYTEASESESKETEDNTYDKPTDDFYTEAIFGSDIPEEDDFENDEELVLRAVILRTLKIMMSLKRLKRR